MRLRLAWEEEEEEEGLVLAERTLELLRQDFSWAGSVRRRRRGEAAAEAVKGEQPEPELELACWAEDAWAAAGRLRRARPAEMADRESALGKSDRRGGRTAPTAPAQAQAAGAGRLGADGAVELVLVLAGLLRSELRRGRAADGGGEGALHRAALFHVHVKFEFLGLDVDGAGAGHGKGAPLVRQAEAAPPGRLALVSSGVRVFDVHLGRVVLGSFYIWTRGENNEIKLNELPGCWR